MIVAPAFVPENCVYKEFRILLDYFLNTNVDEELINFMFWFEKTYIIDNSFTSIDTNGKIVYSWSIY
jgi:hypothetical protein